MPNACDYSVARPAPAALAGAGIVGAVRYCIDGSGPAGKAITKAEYQALLAGGLHVALVQEVGPQPAMRGAAGGTADAKEAEAVVGAVGHTGAIYYVAEDPNVLPVTAWPTVVAYFQAVKAVNPQRKLGAYGSQALVAHLQQLGLVTYGWMVGPWSTVVSGMHLCQRVGGVPQQFTNQIDMDIVLQADWGQATPTPAPAPQPTPTGDTVITPADADVIAAAVNVNLQHDILLLLYGDSLAAAEGKAVQGHPFNLMQMNETLNELKAALATLQADVDGLKTTPAAPVPPAS